MIGVSVQILFILLCVVGAALPLSQFVPWLFAHGFDAALLLLQATSGPSLALPMFLLLRERHIASVS